MGGTAGIFYEEEENHQADRCENGIGCEGCFIGEVVDDPSAEEGGDDKDGGGKTVGKTDIERAFLGGTEFQDNVHVGDQCAAHIAACEEKCGIEKMYRGRKEGDYRCQNAHDRGENDTELVPQPVTKEAPDDSRGSLGSHEYGGEDPGITARQGEAFHSIDRIEGQGQIRKGDEGKGDIVIEEVEVSTEDVRQGAHELDKGDLLFHHGIGNLAGQGEEEEGDIHEDKGGGKTEGKVIGEGIGLNQVDR